MPTEQEQLEAGIAALQAQRARLGDVAVEAAIAGLRSRLAALQGPAQTLRQVSILFLDVVGSTTLARRLDPEEISAVLDGVLARGTAIVEAHRGKVLQYAGDNLLAAFGAGESAEDDPERAVRCGLALLELGRTAGMEVHAAHGHVGFGVRIGIHTGGVLLGGGVDEEGSIRGQAVNVAARMEQTAPAGGLRISHDCYRLVRGLFDVQAQEPLIVKGVDEPVRSYLVLRARPRSFRMLARGIEGMETRMIGRDAELLGLQRAVERLLQPGARLQRLLVVAEAGLGKSRLLYELQDWIEARALPVQSLQARATPQTLGQPYGLLRDLFAWRCQILDSDSMDLAKRKLEECLMPLFADLVEHEARPDVHLLGQLVGLDFADSPHVRGIRDDMQQIRHRGFNAIAQVLRRISVQGGGPIVVQLDDLHWADDGSLDCLDHLAQANRDVPMLLLALARPSYFERREGAVDARIDLRPLDDRGSGTLVDELLKRLPDVPAALRELLIARAEGNPFYMEELVKMLVDQGTIVASRECWSVAADRLLGLSVPSTLTGVLQARLDTLPRQELQALQLASVIGLTFWDAALAHLDETAAEQLPPLQRRELVAPTVTASAVTDAIREYAFHHQILHQVTYDTVLKRVKRQAHARAADWLAHYAGALSKSLLGTAAEHYELAGDTAHAAEYYARAAEHMASTFAHDAALAYTARALKLLHDEPDLHRRLLANRERVLDLLGQRDAQLSDIESLRALAEAMPPGVRRDSCVADAAWRRADIAHRTGDWATQEREARLAQTLAERVGDEALALRAIQRLAQAVAHQGDPASGKALAEAGLARARVLGLSSEMSRLINALTVCTDLLGDRVAGLQYSLKDLSLTQETGNRRNEAVALSNVGMSYLGFGAFDEARRHLQAALGLNRALGNRPIEGNTLSMLSELAWREGNGSLALSHAREALDISIEVRSRLYETDALWSLGNGELALGHGPSATAAFERSEALGRELGLVPQVLNALDGQARVALARGDAKRARELADQLLAQASLPDELAGTYEHLIRLTLYRVWHHTGDPRAARWLADAHEALMSEAARIHDDALQQSFLINIAEHREIVAAWARQPSASSSRSAHRRSS